MALQTTLACGPYDRTLALADGRVRPVGVDLNYLPLEAEEIFYRMARYREFDVAEMSLSSYTLSTQRDAPFVAIPVFPSRTFRHHGVYVREDSEVTEPKQLAGGVVGIPEYQMTASVWIRGILAEHHDLPVDAVSYRTGGLVDPGRIEKMRIEVPGVDIQPIDPETTLTDLLEAGEIDALYTARTPRGFGEPGSRIRRLWTDPREVETEYYRRSSVFPIMHTVVIRRDVYESNRWLARSLLDAFTAAKEEATSRLAEVVALPNLLPWGYLQAEETRELMGVDHWPYGIEENRETLEAFTRYMHEQGLVERKLDITELFAPETHDAFIV